MTQEEKQLLLKDLCARLPYGVKGLHRGEVHDLFTIDGREANSACIQVDSYDAWFPIETFKPYLRPMSSMTEDEFEQMVANSGIKDVEFVSARTCKERMEFYFKTVACDIRNIDWLNAHHFDYRGLIEKGIALEVPEDMYN